MNALNRLGPPASEMLQPSAGLEGHEAHGQRRVLSFLRANRLYVVALIVCILYFTFGIAQIFDTASRRRADTIGYIQQAVQQTKFAIEEHIQEEFDTLKAAAVVAQDRDLLEDDAVLYALIDGLGSHNAYVQIGFADLSGQAVWIDQYSKEHRANLSGDGFFLRAVAGENALSATRADVMSGQSIHYFAVPVYDGKTNAIEGVLFAADPQAEIQNIIAHSLYAGEGLAHIIDSQGDYVVKSTSPLVIGIGTNIFQLKKPLANAIKQDILYDLSVRKANHLTLSFDGECRLIAYAPLDFNEWHVFYAVPEDMVSAGVNGATAGSITLVSLSAAVFILFFLLIRSANNKNRAALEKIAFVDPLTGHKNYQKFLLDAEEILKNAKGVRYALCFSDIRRFKYVNDLFGRDVGNQMLRYRADFQQIISQEREVCSRVGEDAFVALRRYQSRQEIEQQFESAAQHLAVFPQTFSSGYKAELYGGVYVIEPQGEALSLKDMLDRAAAALDKAKHEVGPIRLCFYTKEFREQELWEAELESRMDTALENEEFRIFLQPKISIQEGNRILGAEALVRWDFPEKGLILPGRFIELFEKNGFIVKLDRFVLEQACRYYKENCLEGPPGDFVLSVNVSRLGLMRPDFMRAYTEIRERYGIPANRIELEFTESHILADHTLFKRTVQDCKHNGFLCSMDDFGSGYSSLNILKSIPVDVLKLDRLFFQYGEDAERGQELVRNIVAMAKALEMKTVAEGVEETAQVEALRAMGCDAVQGFVFAKPMPLEEFTSFAASWPQGGVMIAERWGLPPRKTPTGRSPEPSI